MSGTFAVPGTSSFTERLVLIRYVHKGTDEDRVKQQSEAPCPIIPFENTVPPLQPKLSQATQDIGRPVMVTSCEQGGLRLPNTFITCHACSLS